MPARAHGMRRRLSRTLGREVEHGGAGRGVYRSGRNTAKCSANPPNDGAEQVLVMSFSAPAPPASKKSRVSCQTLVSKLAFGFSWGGIA